MTAYLIARVDVTDWDAYREYMKLTPPLVEAHGGKFIARGGEVVTLEGEEETRRVVLLEFPSVADAQTFFDSPGYSEARAVRANAAEAQFVVVSGA